MLGVTSFTVLNWEKGKTAPLTKTMPRLYNSSNIPHVRKPKEVSVNRLLVFLFYNIQDFFMSF